MLYTSLYLSELANEVCTSLVHIEVTLRIYIYIVHTGCNWLQLVFNYFQSEATGNPTN